MVDLQQLHDAQPSLLTDAGNAYDTLSEKFGAHLHSVSDIHDSTGRSWTGSAALQAQLALATQRSQLDAAHTEMLAVGSLLRDAAAEFEAARTNLQHALDDAGRAGYSVAADGTVTAPPAGNGERHDREAMEDRSSAIQAVANRIAQAVRDADSADQRIAAQLDQLASHGKDGTGLDNKTSLDDAGAVKETIAGALPPLSASPQDVNTWWKSLPPDGQKLLIQQYPDLVGNRDGIPADARDQANRISLKQYLADYGNRQPPSDEEKTKLAGFQSIQARLDRDARNSPPEFLYGLSDQEQGRAILSFGNPDTAANVSAYVPGLGTQLQDIGGKDGTRALNVWTAAHTADSSRTTASMVWLGYDPPPGLESGDPRTAEVMNKDRAERGAVSYDQFMAGLRASHDGPPAHLTALGHSYGSLTVGLAAQRPGGTGADDVVLIGSPGTGARNASQLGVAPDRVWVGAAKNDPVTSLPSPNTLDQANQRVKFDLGSAALGGMFAGPVGAVVGGWMGDSVAPQVGSGLWFGQDPASAGFGARRFDVADGPLGISAHSNYLDPSGGNSLANIGQIVAGHPDKVNGQPPR